MYTIYNWDVELLPETLTDVYLKLKICEIFYLWSKKSGAIGGAAWRRAFQLDVLYGYEVIQVECRR